jgi:hypothetical protein
MLFYLPIPKDGCAADDSFHERSDAQTGVWERWHLIITPEAKYLVEYEWTRASRSGELKPDSGKTVMSVGQFLATSNDNQLLGLLRAAITKSLT